MNDKNGQAESGVATAATPTVSTAPAPGMIDPRGPRFAAAITVVVLALILVLLPSIWAVVLLVWQAVAFGAAAFFGLQAQPYSRIYRSVVRPRLGPPTEWEAEAPPRFAQQVGLGFITVAMIGLAFGLPIVATVAVAFALAAAFLNAAFNFCLGCEMYLRYQRFTAKRSAAE